MTKVPWFTPSSRQIQLSLWAWVSILLQFSSLVYSLESLTLKTDQPPRAALVTLAHDNDLPGMLYSIRQLEDKFNNRYQYHWVFFSPRELSEDFKRSTSNATNATCIYEVISDEYWNVPNWIDRRRFHPTDDANLSHGYCCEGTDADLRQIYRWNSGPFAKEKRLKNYDWFLRVEPGVSYEPRHLTNANLNVQFTRDIEFDVFRFMRDNGIAYGFNKAVLDETNIREIKPRIRSFIDKNPDLLHEDADVSWLLDHPEVDATSNIAADNDEDDTALDADEESGSLAEAFTSWLSGIYESSLYPTFEIGSLAFFRSPNHLAFFDHLDNAGDFYYKRVEDVSVHTLSASMFLPKQSVWNFRRRDIRHRFQLPSLPEPTPDPEYVLLGVGADKRYSIPSLVNEKAVKEAMEARLAEWDVLARELEKQDKMPGLMSGNTVIDGRNFALTH